MLISFTLTTLKFNIVEMISSRGCRKFSSTYKCRSFRSNDPQQGSLKRISHILGFQIRLEKRAGKGEFNPDLGQCNGTRRLSISLATWRALFEDQVRRLLLDLRYPFSSLFASLLSRPDSFLINLRLHPFALFQDFLLLGRPPLLPSCFCPLFHSSPPVREEHGRRRNDQRAPFGRFVPGFFKFRPVRPVDWSVKTGRKKMAAILGQLARSMPTLPSVRLWLDFFRAPISRAECESLIIPRRYLRYFIPFSRFFDLLVFSVLFSFFFNRLKHC